MRKGNRVSDDSQLIWSTVFIGELLRRLNAKCVEHVKRDEMEKALRYAWLAGCAKDAVKEA